MRSKKRQRKAKEKKRESEGNLERNKRLLEAAEPTLQQSGGVMRGLKRNVTLPLIGGVGLDQVLEGEEVVGEDGDAEEALDVEATSMENGRGEEGGERREVGGGITRPLPLHDLTQRQAEVGRHLHCR
jgi:hypothetical protein